MIEEMYQSIKASQIDMTKPFPVDRLSVLPLMLRSISIRPTMTYWLKTVPYTSHGDVEICDGMLNLRNFKDIDTIHGAAAGHVPWTFSYRSTADLDVSVPSGEFLHAITDEVIKFEESIDLRFLDSIKPYIKSSFGEKAIGHAINALEEAGLTPLALFSAQPTGLPAISMNVIGPTFGHLPLDLTDTFVVAERGGTMMTSPRAVNLDIDKENKTATLRISKILGFVVDPRHFYKACLKEAKS